MADGATQPVLEALEAAGLGHIEYQPDTGAFRSSSVAKRHFGRRADEPFTYDDLLACVHPLDAPVRARALERALSEGEDYRLELRVRWPDGAIRWLQIAGRAVPSPSGKVISAISRDITDQQYADAALRESEERFRQIADSAPTPMWITEANGSRHFVNRAYYEFLGCAPDAARSFDWRQIIHPDDMDRVVRESVAGEASMAPFALEGRYRRADGAWRWLRSVSQPRLGPDGGHIGFIGIALDITEIKLAQQELESANDRLEERVEAAVAEKLDAEAALRQSQRLEAVGQLTSGVAHDFNNLLTVILGNIRQLEKRAEDPAMQRRLATMTLAAERGAQLTSQLLAFSRRQRLEPRPTDLNETVHRMADLLRSTTGGGIDLELRLAERLSPALVDPAQVELVILNLAINARDAMDGHGRLTIQTANVRRGEPQRPEEPAAGDYVMLSVRDTGCGMSEEVRAKAFEPFFTTKDVGKGSGLGLSQVLGLAKQSGGGLVVETAPGEGAAIALLLPPTEPAPAALADAPAARTTSPGRGATVLLVDDDDDVREVTASALTDAGFVVRSAGAGAEAISILEAQDPIDLVLLDFAMPGMNGAEVAGACASLRPDLPIVFITGYADHKALDGLTRHPVIRKPFSAEELAQRIDSALAGGTPSGLGH